MKSRKQYWIMPDFQWRMIRHWALLVLVTNAATCLITVGLVKYQDRQMPGQYFYTMDKLEASPVIVDPVVVKRQDIIFPALLIALIVGMGASVMAGVLYSHRLAGPLYRIRRTLSEVQEGKPLRPIVLRKNDEFKELAEDLNGFLSNRTP